MDGWIFYAYWNGAQLRDLFEALAAVAGAGGFVEAAGVLLLAGVLFMFAAGSTKNEGRGIITYFACAVLFWFVAIVPKTTVVVHDVRSEAVWNVDNVPLGIAAPGSLASRLGYWLTETYESAFAPVEVAKFSKFGAVYPERVLEVLQSVGPVTGEGRAAADAFVTACVLPELLTDAAKAAALTASADVWATVSAEGWVNPARLAAMPAGVVGCAEAVKGLETVLRDVELPAVKRILGAKLAPNHADPAAVVASAVPQAEGLLLGLSRTMDASLRHSLLMNAVPAALEKSAGADPLAMAVTLAKSQGNLAGEINYRTMARMAEESLPKIRNALEFAIIALFPVMVLAALVAGSGMAMILRSYMTLLVSVQVWPALSSVVNYLVVAYDTHPYTQIAREFGGNTLQAAALIRETGATSQAVAGALMCAVPVIAYALVRAGEFGVGQLVGGLMTPAQSAASAQGNSLAAGNVNQGNVQLGNVSANNVSSNKSDASVRAVQSGTLVTQSARGTVTRADGGEVTGISRTPVSIGISTMQSQSYARGHASSHVSQLSAVWSDAAKFNFSQAASSSDATQRSFAHAFRDALQNERGLANQDTNTHSVSNVRGVGHSTDMAVQNTVSEGTGVASSGNLSVVGALQKRPQIAPVSANRATGVSGVGAVVGAVGQVAGAAQQGFPSISEGLPQYSAEKGGSSLIELKSNVNFTTAQQLLEQASGRSQATSNEAALQAYGRVQTALERVAASNSDESVRSAARSMQASLARSRSSAKEQTQTMVGSVSAVSNLDETRRGELSTQVDGSIGVMQRSIESFGSAEAVLERMYEPKTPSMTAGDVHFESVMGIGDRDTFGPGAMQSVVSANREVESSAIATLNARHAEFADRVNGHSALPDVEVGSVDASGVRSEVQSVSDSVRRDLSMSESGMDFERGVLLVSREAYRRDNEDKNYALINAFLGGLTYRSGESLQDALRERAAASQEITNVLREIGASGGSSVTAQQWSRLSKAGGVD